MNICFLAGVITDIYNFKFIYNNHNKYKCFANFRLEINETQEFEIRAFDENIDLIIRNKFKFVYIRAKLVEEMKIELIEIY